MAYFSRIAKQCGVRFPGDGKRAADPGKAKPERAPTPLEYEETRFLSPTGNAGMAQNAPGSVPGFTSRIAAQQETPGTPMQPGWQEQESGLNENTPPRIDVAIDAQSGQFKPEVLRATDEPAAGLKAQNISEPITFKPEKITAGGTGAAGEENTLDRGEGLEGVESTLSELTTIEIEGPTRSNEKQHAVKTAETLDSGNLTSEEIQNIVFQEVVNWAAVSTIDPETGGRASQTDPVEIFKDGSRIEPADLKPGVIRISGKSVEREETDREQRAEKGRMSPSFIEEQSFDLSIGTITVVIENEEKEPHKTLTASPERGDRNTKQGSASGSSRLSRSYL